MSEAKSGTVVVEYLSEQLGLEEQRRGRLDTRSTAIASVGFIILTTLTAILGLTQKATGIVSVEKQLGTTAQIAVVVGLILITISIGSAIVAALPRHLDYPKIESLEAYLTPDAFEEPASYSDLNLAVVRLKQLKSLREANSSIVCCLLIGQILQAFGILLIASAVAQLAF